MRELPTFTSLIFLAVAAVCPKATGATIVDNLGSVTGPSFDIPAGSRGGQQFITTTTAYILTGLEIVGYSDRNDQEIAFAVYSNSSSKPGTRIVTLYAGSSGDLDFNQQVTAEEPSVLPSFSVSLQPNTRYWIVLENLSQNRVMWGISDPPSGSGGGGPGFLSLSLASPGLTGSTWSTNSDPYGMKLQAIPEPHGAALLLVCAGHGLFLRRRKVKNPTGHD
jgi:hypothetical protein